MELNIFELNKNELIKRSFEQIPENIISTKNDIIRDPTISKQNAKIIKETFEKTVKSI